MIRLVSWNCCSLPPLIINQNGFNDLKSERLTLFFHRIASKYDVVALCEVWDSCLKIGGLVDPVKIVNNLRKRLGFDYVAFVPCPRFSIVNSGLYIVSKFPITYQNELIFKTTSGFQALVNNGILHARIKLPSPNKFVSVFVYHLNCGVKDSAFLNDANQAASVQYGQASEIRQFLLNEMKRFPIEQRQCILTGDSNVCSMNETVCGKQGSNLTFAKFKEALGIHSVKTNPLNLRYLYTDMTYPNPLTGSFLINKKCINEAMTIDHIFTNLEGKAETIAVKENGIELSDHFALSFDWPITSRENVPCL